MRTKNGLLKLLKKKLLVPLWRSPHPPEYKAWGVAVGLAWAMTPLVGIQMSLVWLTWFVARKFNFHFSLALGIAWTWLTNVFTMVPVYYVFYLTGRLMMGKSLLHTEGIKDKIRAIFIDGTSFVQQWKDFLTAILKDWGGTMMLGCIPYVMASIFLGYHLTLRYERMRQKHRENKMKQRGKNGTNTKLSGIKRD